MNGAEKCWRSLPKTSNGSLHVEFKKCGEKNCRCARGLLHGPYFALFYREQGRLRKIYVPQSKLGIALEELRQRQLRRAEWRRLRLEMKDL